VPDPPRDLRTAWDEQAEAWTRWARRPGHDTYWRFGRDAFFSMLPPAGRLTLDLGCGEGRVSRDLVAAGHRVVALDGSLGMARAAHDAAPSVPVLVADAARIPLADATTDLVVAYMTLHDFDDMSGALQEAARVLDSGGRLCMGVVHPINSAGDFVSLDDGAVFVIEKSYFEPRRYVDRIERDGLTMTFSSRHHPLEEYVGRLADAGFTLETLREITSDEGRWKRLPMFLFIRAVKK
jgi:SAM-dependent methyltransferase